MLVHRTHPSVSLVEWLVKKALWQQYLWRLRLWSLVSILGISSYGSVARLILPVLRRLVLSVLSIYGILRWNASPLGLLAPPVIRGTSRCLMGLVLTVSTDLFLGVEGWCRLLHVQTTVAIVILTTRHQFRCNNWPYIVSGFRSLASTWCSSMVVASNWPVYSPCVLIKGLVALVWSLVVRFEYFALVDVFLRRIRTHHLLVYF